MFLRVFRNLLRGIRRSTSPDRPRSQPAGLTAWFHLGFSRNPSDDETFVAEIESELSQAFPELAASSIVPQPTDESRRVIIPEGVDLDSITRNLTRSQSFNWQQQGEVVSRDMFNAHDIHFKKTVGSLWRTKSETLRRRVENSKVKTMDSAYKWLEAFVSTADPQILPCIEMSIHKGEIWDQLAYRIDALLVGADGDILVDNPNSPASGKGTWSPDPTVFFALGVTSSSDSEEMCLKVFSVRLTAWAQYDLRIGHLQSGIKGELKSLEYEVSYSDLAMDRKA